MKICPDCNKVIAPRDAIAINGKTYHKSCRVCSSCGHFLSPKTNYGRSFLRYFYEDGEIKSKESRICGKCESTVIKTEQDIERCRKEVLEIFRSHKITGIPEDVPIVLSDMKAESIKMGMMLAGLHHAVISPSRSRYSFSIKMEENMPEMNFKGVLGHELLHSWQRLYAIDLPKEECEGFCNLGEELVLKAIGTPESKYWLHRVLETNDDPVYGDGYRLMKKRLDKLGWEGLMQAVRWENKTKESIEL